MLLKTEREDSTIHPDWPEAKWNVSGLYNYRLFQRVFVNTLNSHNMLPVLGAVHGCPDLIWNGGYLNARVPNTDSEKFCEVLNKHDIGMFLAFTNIALEEKHLSDPTANTLLEQLDESSGINGVIVASNLLSEHIKKKKPGLKQICSYEKALIENPQGDAGWYKMMQRQFDRVIIYPDHVFDLELLDQLDRDKTEIIVNDECAFRCQTRKRHLMAVSRFNIQPSPQIGEELKHIKQKHCTGEFGIISPQKNPAHVRPNFLRRQELKTIYDMGFRNFRICGRRKTIFGLAWNVIHFIFNPALAPPFASAWAHKIDDSFKAEFKKLGQGKEERPQHGASADKPDIV